MSWNPNHVLYACVAKGTTILAEFNSKDADLGELAAKCLDKTPPLHSTFSHTVRGKTYMFLISDLFVHFGIFNSNLENPDCLSFLNSVKDSFEALIDGNSVKELEKLTSHCYQGEFNPVFHKLLSSNSYLERPISPRDDSGSSDSLAKKIGSFPLLADASTVSMKNNKKKKRSFFRNSNGESQENKVDVLSDDDVTLSREHHKNLFGSDSQKLAKRAWKKQVLVVLLLDLIVCCILFAVWLWICRGFQCVAG